jgi:RNA polymerase sigma-70 factor (ECF subfamily)
MTRQPPDAEDVTQEAFLSVWRRADMFDPRYGSLQGWLLRIVRNRAIDIHRQSSVRDKRLVGNGEEAFARAAASGDALTKVTESELRDQLADSLRHLPPEQARVIALAHVAGMTHTEIASFLELPEGTVKGRLRLGLMKMRRSLTAEPRGAHPAEDEVAQT